MQSSENYTYSLHLDTVLSLYKYEEPVEDEAPFDYYTDIHGRIMAAGDDGEVDVGRIDAFLIDLHRTSSPWEILDSRSGEIEGLYGHVFGEDDGIMRTRDCGALVRRR